MVEQEEKIENGLRKGMTKEKLIKSMSKEDWKFMDKCKQAQDMKINNEVAYELFVKSDQMYQEYLRLRSLVYDTVSNILLLHYDIQKNKVKATLYTESKEEDDEANPQEIECLNTKQESKITMALATTYANLARLYTMVNKQGLDRKIFFTEEQYNEIIQNIVVKLEKTPYKLY